MSIFEILKSLPNGIRILCYEGSLSILPQDFKGISSEGIDNYYNLKPFNISFTNLSNYVFEDVRIKIPVNISYDPLIFNKLGKTPNDWVYCREKHEVIVKKLDPYDNVYIYLYAENRKDLKEIRKPLIFVDGKKISLINEIIGDIKSFKFLYTIMFLIFALVFGVCSYAVYPEYFPIKTERLQIKEAAERISGCEMKVFKVNTKIDENISINRLPVEMVFLINKVENINELKTKDEIVLCMDTE
ncbi:hypothetical protein QZJ90_14115 [Acinetobacter baumannii]|nr:hypothetical protein [Acinetobacter baumannii]